MFLIRFYSQIIIALDASQTITSILVIGLLSSLHCLGMCGGIMGALSLSLPADVRENRIQISLFVTAYNLGRISSYMLAGTLAGAFGVEILELLGLNDDSAHAILRILGAAFIVLIGLYLGGWFPQLIKVEKLGQPVWKLIEPVTRRLMPIKTPYQALLYGMLWGWLPCGLVYVILLMTVTSGSAIQGALMMGAFGLGTLPAMLSAGVMLSWVRKLGQSGHARQIIAAMLIITAIASLFIDVGDAGHHQYH